VYPIKPTLKAPDTKHLRQQNDELLPNFAFKFNLRGYMLELVVSPSVSRHTHPHVRQAGPLMTLHHVMTWP